MIEAAYARLAAFPALGERLALADQGLPAGALGMRCPTTPALRMGGIQGWQQQQQQQQQRDAAHIRGGGVCASPFETYMIPEEPPTTCDHENGELLRPASTSASPSAAVDSAGGISGSAGPRLGGQLAQIPTNPLVDLDLNWDRQVLYKECTYNIS